MTSNDPRPESSRRNATVLESVEEIRALARQGATVREAAPRTLLARSEASQGIAATDPFRPVDRPPMGLLVILDDGDETGEPVRIRASTFLIGRVEGDLVVPHDGGISGRHAEISRRGEGGEFRWYLRDLQSTNGTFVRVSQVVLHPGQEVLVGRVRLRFEMVPPTLSVSVPSSAGPAEANATRKWQVTAPTAPPPPSSPVLVELTPQGEGRRFPLTEPESWVGRDPSCRVALNDPTVDPKHARAVRDPKGRWVLANAKSVNGLWARVEEVSLGVGGYFQCGEQRFLFKVL